ncbi:MAG: lamin tail domain-containing protein [Flavobacteriales bacterium]|nr:lamin tail domain-containing protein [Flavobacteriales bacterium]
MYRIIFFFLIFGSPCLRAQTIESFDKSTSIPSYWEGNINQFQVNSDQQLQLNDNKAGTSSIYFNSIIPNHSSIFINAYNIEWQIKVKQSFSGSDNNNSRIYLMAEQSTLRGTMNAYFIQLGEGGSGDAIKFNRQEGISYTPEIAGAAGAIASSFEIRIKVILDSTNTWSLYVDYDATSDFELIGSFVDPNLLVGSYFGISCKYTSSNASKFYFDDLYIGQPLAGSDPFIDSSLMFIEQANQHDLIINEVLSDPLPFGVDFIEVYNNSDKTVNLKNWQLANLDNYDGNISNHKIICDDNCIVYPEEYIVLTKDSSNIQFEYPASDRMRFIQMEILPTYSNAAGTVVLLNDSNLVIDSMSYHEDMQFALLGSGEGVSLERLHFDRPSSEITNWHSAAEKVGFATPGYQNSQFNLVSSDLEIAIIPESFSPNNDGFDDVVNINYNFRKAGFVGNISLYDSYGRKIKQLVNNELLSMSGTFSWDGINENNTLSFPGIYIVYFEAFHLDGEVEKFKEVCVLAR